MIAFGPVPSRRLGRSLGINNIPPKICTYACVYCQLGRTIKMQMERQPFYEPEEILRDVREKVEKAKEAREPIDYLTFVPDGEPTLDINLGREIELLRSLGITGLWTLPITFPQAKKNSLEGHSGDSQLVSSYLKAFGKSKVQGIKIAVITNSSLMWREDVREALMKADWVSLKMDSVQEETWRKVNRPYGTLRLDSILDGALQFASKFKGELATETMLVRGVNDGDDHIKDLAGFLARLEPAVAYLAIPTRPPAERWVQSPAEEVINRAYQIFSGTVDRVEYLVGYEGNAFAFTGDVEEDLLSITAVHPMREDAVDEFLARAGADWTAVYQLVAQDRLVEAEYEGHRFYLRRLGGHKDRG
ncbi:MAG: radical SAM protein [Chloroflexi bacterium]|nr:MAG: radical SAM protein [Chloroflexota bacterium]